MSALPKSANLGSLVEVATLEGHTDRVWSAAWSPSGRSLATSGGDAQIRIWTKEKGTQKWICQKVLEGVHTRTVRRVAWSPNGRYLASASFDGTTAIWDMQTSDCECIATLEGHENEVKCVAWASAGQMLATCSRDKSVWIWEADSDQDFECVSVLHGHSQDVKAVKWHPTEQYIISCSYDNSLKMWTDEEDDWYCTGTFSEHTSTVWEFAFEWSGERLVSCSDDRALVVWRKREATAGNSSILSAPVGAKSGWEMVCKIPEAHKRCIFSVDWSKNGLLVSGGADDTIRVFQEVALTEEEETQLKISQAAKEEAEGAKKETKAMEEEDEEEKTEEKKEKKKEEPNECSFKLVGEIRGHASDINCVSWSPDGSLLASAGDDMCVKIWKFVPHAVPRRS